MDMIFCDNIRFANGYPTFLLMAKKLESVNINDICT